MRRLSVALWMVALMLTMGTLTAEAENWPQFAGPNRDAKSGETGLIEKWPDGGPETLWTVDMGVGFGAPVVYGDKVYVLDREKGKSDILRCLDLESGKELWRYGWKAEGGVPHPGSRAQPLVDEKYVFAVGAHGHLYCFNRRTHRPVWHTNIVKEYGGKVPTWGISQSPLSYGDTVIVMPNGSEAGVVAFDKSTGEEVWKSPPFEKRKRGSYCSPMLATIGGVDQVLATTPNETMGVNAKTGEKLWSYTDWFCKIPITSPVHMGDGRVLITGGYGAGTDMVHVKKDGGFSVSRVWRNEDVNCQMHQPILHENHIYIMGNSNRARGGLMCLDMQGNVVWKTGRNPNFQRGGMLLAQDMLFAVDAQGQGRDVPVVLIDPSSSGYKELGRTNYLKKPKAWSPPVLSQGRLFVRDQNQMKCLDVRGK